MVATSSFWKVIVSLDYVSVAVFTTQLHTILMQSQAAVSPVPHLNAV